MEVLDGGLPTWKRQDLPLESGGVAVDRSEFEAKPRPELLTTVEQVEASLGLPEGVIIDARHPERYRGEREPYDPIAGRIPAALNHHWQQKLGARGRILPSAQLRQALRASLADAGPRLISCCGSGVTPAHNVLAMVAAGLPEPEMYVGSWSDWCAERSPPVERGE